MEKFQLSMYDNCGEIEHFSTSYMQKTCDVAEKAILAKKNLRKKCVNRDKTDLMIDLATKRHKLQ